MQVYPDEYIPDSTLCGPTLVSSPVEDLTHKDATTSPLESLSELKTATNTQGAERKEAKECDTVLGSADMLEDSVLYQASDVPLLASHKPSIYLVE